MRRSGRDVLDFFVAAWIAVALACNDSTGTVPTPTTYSVTTTLDSFLWETAAPSPPDCPGFNGFPYCEHSHAFVGAVLSGTLLISPESITTVFGTGPKTTGTFSGTFCDAISDTGCIHVAPTPVTNYVGIVSGGNTKGTSFLDLSSTPQGPWIVLSGIFGSDSLFGVVSWGLRTGRGAPAHSGRFAAHRAK
jgi:hypothetical protein